VKETEHVLQMREHELLGIIETIPSMLWSASPTAETTHLSQRFLEYFGASFEEIANRGWASFIHPDDREETVKAFARQLTLESHIEQYTACDAQMESTFGITRWAKRSELKLWGHTTIVRSKPSQMVLNHSKSRRAQRYSSQ
jgi:PAS domain S-box-containing protein